MAEAPTEIKFTDEMQELTHKQLAKFITDRNALVGKANAASGDRVTLTEQITENSTDSEIVAARQARDEAIMRLHELVTPQVEAIVADSQGSMDEVEASIKEIDSKLKPGLTYYRKLYGEDAAGALPTQERLKGTQIRSGASGRRVRGFRVEVTLDGETTGFENFTQAAKFLDVETADLQSKFFEAAGNPKQVKDAPNEVKFAVNITEVDEDENETVKEVLLRAYRPEADTSSDDEED